LKAAAAAHGAVLKEEQVGEAAIALFLPLYTS
jgi:hypothetical protein